MIYQGKPDFQKIVKLGSGVRVIGAYDQADTYFKYPLPRVNISDKPKLDFKLDLIRSADSSRDISGKLEFTTQFAYKDSYPDFTSKYPNASLVAVPLDPFKLGFYAPSGNESNLDKVNYNANWSSTDFANFLINLDQSTAILIERTLKDNVVGFSARLDAYVEGVSPRFDNRVILDPSAVINALGAKVKAPGGGYLYQALQDEIFILLSNQSFLSLLEFDYEPKPADFSLLSEALLDRIFNNCGELLAGPSNSNMALVKLNLPSGRTRLELVLSKVELTKRPVVFQFDPFAAAQKLAKVDINKVIYRYDAPSIPAGKREVLVIAVLPIGMQGIDAVLSVTVPAGVLISTPQVQTVELKNEMQVKPLYFENNDFSSQLSYSYKIQVNYFDGNAYRHFKGTTKQSQSQELLVNVDELPCKFMTFSISETLASIANLEGTFHSGSQKVTFSLSKSSLSFSYPILEQGSFATFVAVALADGQKVILPGRLTKSTTVGEFNFPGFGNQLAKITAILGSGVTFKTVEFQAEGNDKTTSHTFTSASLIFDYKWTPVSIFKSRYRYRIGTGTWSGYLKGDQTITIN